MGKYNDLIRELYSPAGRVSINKFAAVLFCLLIPFIVFIVLLPSYPSNPLFQPPLSDYMFFLFLLYVIFILLPIQLCNLIKRLHDSGRSGWWWFIALIPYIGPLILLYFLFVLSGTDGPNKYGEKPTR
jgi:uncharacterized membrane protein YhaH (DUF805 family)